MNEEHKDNLSGNGLELLNKLSEAIHNVTGLVRLLSEEEKVDFMMALSILLGTDAFICFGPKDRKKLDLVHMTIDRGYEMAGCAFQSIIKMKDYDPASFEKIIGEVQQIRERYDKPLK